MVILRHSRHLLSLPSTASFPQILCRFKKTEAKAPPPPKKDWFQRVMDKEKKAKVKTYVESYPPRVQNLNEKGQPPPNETFVFLSNYDRPVYSFKDAIQMHRETMAPSMFDCPDVFVRIRLELNMNLERKKAFVPSSEQIVLVPHPFEHRELRFICVFMKNQQDYQKVQEAGADIVGGVDLVKKGVIRPTVYNVYLAHVDMGNDIVALRAILKKNYPSNLNGALGTDIPALIETFKYGIRAKVRQDAKHQMYGLSDTVIGKLDMPIEQLEANADSVIKKVCQSRANKASLGHFIHRAMIMLKTDVVKEYFLIDHKLYSPPLPDKDEEESDKGERRRRARG